MHGVNGSKQTLINTSDPRIKNSSNAQVAMNFTQVIQVDLSEFCSKLTYIPPSLLAKGSTKHPATSLVFTVLSSNCILRLLQLASVLVTMMSHKS